MDSALVDLLYQALETEQGGIKIYEQALTCAINKDLHKEWSEYLEETRRHEQVLLAVFDATGLDPETRTTGRDVVAGIGKSLVAAMRHAQSVATRAQAEIVACECVVLAETKDHANWELLAHVAKQAKGPVKDLLTKAVESVEDEEDHHLFHTRGWMRELWLQALGYDAVLPPPEEIRKVETAIGASRAEQAREEYL
jgi:rubrerythrin